MKVFKLKSYCQTVLVDYETNETQGPKLITYQPPQMNSDHTDMQDRKLLIHQPPLS